MEAPEMAELREEGLTVTPYALEEGLTVTPYALEEGLTVTPYALEKGLTVTPYALEKGLTVSPYALEEVLAEAQLHTHQGAPLKGEPSLWNQALLSRAGDMLWL
ncbi:hypothetical protein NHX12_007218 [Muraenolepis orangiensis]|uniref:Uncharacterized protein n=1 Tax=Muraenolepis orangiensis TaxID=630683 RepID=A0A9Q0IAZ1_9TELE|nr:hypothetical protein NHX12_007218 [Muraenolepis orangiensis]